MSLLNPASAYRRSASRPRIPVVLPLVRVTVDDIGALSVTVDDEPLADEVSVLMRGELRSLLERIATEHGSALRVEIHEPDGKVFTDFHTPEPTAATEPTPKPVSRERGARDARPMVRVQAGSVFGGGFRPGEEVVVAIIVHRISTSADGTLDLSLPVALLDRTASDVVIVGEKSGATRPSPVDTDTSEHEAS